MGRPAKTMPTKARLEELYATRSLKEVGEELGVSASTTLQWMRRLKVPLRPSGRGGHRTCLPRPEPEITIAEAEASFDPKDGGPRLCVRDDTSTEDVCRMLREAWERGRRRGR